jgi:hypothetical protein
MCGSRFSTQSGAMKLARCRHWSEGSEEPCFWSRLVSAADVCGFIQDHRPHNQRRTDQSVLSGASSCGPLHACGPEVGAVDPHAVQDHGQLASHRDNSAAMAADYGRDG